MNRGFCNRCHGLVAAESVTRDGRVFLVKKCPTCGPTETLISSDAVRYQSKRALDDGAPAAACALNCNECRHPVQPVFVFLDVTNRCNLNCPICINNTPSMGFLFEPPLDYFDRIFRDLAAREPRPEIQLFGGEPTVRQDLFEIMKLARSYGLKRIRVVTNGLKLADEDYCRRLVESRATVLIAYDGQNPETYRMLRANEGALGKKLQAIENLRKIPGAKMALMTCFAKGFNDHEMRDLVAFCHERRDLIRGVNFMPLTQTWDTADFNFSPERTTSEDIELVLAECYPEERIEFLPAGISGLKALVKYLRLRPIVFAGAHPNCESMYLLVSNGTEYVPLTRYLKRTLADFAVDLRQADERFARKVVAKGRTVTGQLSDKPDWTDRLLSLRARLAVFRVARRHVWFSRVLKGRGIAKAWHALSVAFGMAFKRRSRILVERHLAARNVLQVFVLPFEDEPSLESERMERCPNAFVFWDPDRDEVKTVPVCVWSLHKGKALKAISDHYARTAEAVG